MEVLASANEFLDQLRQSKLLTLEEFLAAEESLGDFSDLDALSAAKSLVKSGVITRFQAQRLLEGHAKGFFVGHFRIDDILGSGGMGWAYIAHDLRTNEEVALKMLCEQNEGDAGLLTRFMLEARAGLRLNHPAIVRTREVGDASGLYGAVHYMVMDLVRGVSVDELVALGGPIAWPLACHIARHVAAGLHHAHRQNLVHRDIKPGNVLVDQHSSARVLDFGLSLASQSVLDDEFSLAMIFGQDCLGTADYIAPEQARDSFNVDLRADIYSLGAMMYFMLTGHVLFPHRTTRAQKIESQLREAPRPIRDLVPSVPEEVARILHKMLAKNPGERFATARDVCAALEPFAKPKSIQFDFQHILNRRYAIARQREKMADARAKRAAVASSLSVCSADSKAVKPTQAQIETAIQKDTHSPRRKTGHQGDESPRRIRDNGPDPAQ